MRACVCVYTCIPHRVSTVFPYVSVSLTSCRKTAACVCVCVCALVCVCAVDSALSDFVSGFLTHVLMAIKEFSLFVILFSSTVFFPSLYSRNTSSRIK